MPSLGSPDAEQADQHTLDLERLRKGNDDEDKLRVKIVALEQQKISDAQV